MEAPRLKVLDQERQIRLSDPVDDGAQFNTTSMIDVIFILLIFFLSISSLRESRLQVELPEASTDALRAEELGRDELTVEVSQSGVFFIGGEEVTGREALAEVVAREAEAGTNRIVRIKGDRDARNGDVMMVVGELARAGLTRVEFVVEEAPR